MVRSLTAVRPQYDAVYAYPYGEYCFDSRNGGSLEHLEYWSFLSVFASNFSVEEAIPARTRVERPVCDFVRVVFDAVLGSL